MPETPGGLVRVVPVAAEVPLQPPVNLAGLAAHHQAARATPEMWGLLVLLEIPAQQVLPETQAFLPLGFVKLSPAARAEEQAMAAPEVTAAPEVMAGQGAIKVEQVRVAVAVPALRALFIPVICVHAPQELLLAAVAGEGRALAIQVILVVVILAVVGVFLLAVMADQGHIEFLSPVVALPMGEIPGLLPTGPQPAEEAAEAVGAT